MDKQSLKRLVIFFARPDKYAEIRLPRIFLSLSVMVNSRYPIVLLALCLLVDSSKVTGYLG